MRVVGNPTRSVIRPVANKRPADKLHVLVFGGSLGAKQINDVIYELIQHPPFTELVIHHQTGVEPTNRDSRVEYVAKKYIDDMQSEYEWSDVIISRAGASTVSELAIIKKPVILFPFPQATDNHQYYNAKIFQEASDFSTMVLDPQIPQAEALKEVKEFLVKARAGELEYTKNQSPGNVTCEAIIREIFEDVGMA